MLCLVGPDLRFLAFYPTQSALVADLIASADVAPRTDQIGPRATTTFTVNMEETDEAKATTSHPTVTSTPHPTVAVTAIVTSSVVDFDIGPTVDARSRSGPFVDSSGAEASTRLGGWPLSNLVQCGRQIYMLGLLTTTMPLLPGILGLVLSLVWLASATVHHTLMALARGVALTCALQGIGGLHEYLRAKAAVHGTSPEEKGGMSPGLLELPHMVRWWLSGSERSPKFGVLLRFMGIVMGLFGSILMALGGTRHRNLGAAGVGPEDAVEVLDRQFKAFDSFGRSTLKGIPILVDHLPGTTWDFTATLHYWPAVVDKESHVVYVPGVLEPPDNIGDKEAITGTWQGIGISVSCTPSQGQAILDKSLTEPQGREDDIPVGQINNLGLNACDLVMVNETSLNGVQGTIGLGIQTAAEPDCLSAWHICRLTLESNADCIADAQTIQECRPTHRHLKETTTHTVLSLVQARAFYSSTLPSQLYGSMVHETQLLRALKTRNLAAIRVTRYVTAILAEALNGLHVIELAPGIGTTTRYRVSMETREGDWRDMYGGALLVAAGIVALAGGAWTLSASKPYLAAMARLSKLRGVMMLGACGDIPEAEGYCAAIGSEFPHQLHIGSNKHHYGVFLEQQQWPDETHVVRGLIDTISTTNITPNS
jgi:hypothetical protein